MEYRDKSLVCVECHQPFIWTAGEQLFYADKNFKNEPKRCKDCKSKRNSRMSAPPRERGRDSPSRPLRGPWDTRTLVGFICPPRGSHPTANTALALATGLPPTSTRPSAKASRRPTRVTIALASSQSPLWAAAT